MAATNDIRDQTATKSGDSDVEELPEVHFILVLSRLITASILRKT